MLAGEINTLEPAHVTSAGKARAVRSILSEVGAVSLLEVGASGRSI